MKNKNQKKTITYEEILKLWHKQNDAKEEKDRKESPDYNELLTLWVSENNIEIGSKVCMNNGKTDHEYTVQSIQKDAIVLNGNRYCFKLLTVA